MIYEIQSVCQQLHYKLTAYFLYYENNQCNSYWIIQLNIGALILRKNFAHNLHPKNPNYKYTELQGQYCSIKRKIKERKGGGSGREGEMKTYRNYAS